MTNIRLADGGKVWRMCLPSSFNELSAAQFEAVVGATDDLAGQTDLWRSLGVPPSLLKELPVWVSVELAGKLAFLTDPNPTIDHFIMNVVPGPYFFNQKLYAPNPRLEYVSLQQFMTIDSFFSYYASTKDEKFLNQMMAAIFLREGEGFVRDGLHHKLVPLEQRAKFFAKSSKVLKDATLLNWVMIKNWLSTVYKNLFPRGEENTGGKPAEWLTLFDNFVGDNIPYMESYQRMECMDAFRIIDRKIEEQKKRALA